MKKSKMTPYKAVAKEEAPTLADPAPSPCPPSPRAPAQSCEPAASKLPSSVSAPWKMWRGSYDSPNPPLTRVSTDIPRCT